MDYLIYATFSTAVNSIGGSAVCAFRLRDVTNVFNGHFKEQRDMSSNWQSVPDHKVGVQAHEAIKYDAVALRIMTLSIILKIRRSA